MKKKLLISEGSVCNNIVHNSVHIVHSITVLDLRAQTVLPFKLKKSDILNYV